MRYNKDGTVAEYSKAKETRTFNGKEFILEESIYGDYALIKAHKADKLGNCQFRKSMNNFNEAMAKNAKFTIVEADKIVEVGEIDPESVHIQGIYVDAVIQSTEPKAIEKLTFAKDPSELLQAGKFTLVLRKESELTFSKDLVMPLLVVSVLSSVRPRSSRTACTLTLVSACL